MGREEIIEPINGLINFSSKIEGKEKNIKYTIIPCGYLAVLEDKKENYIENKVYRFDNFEKLKNYFKEKSII